MEIKPYETFEEASRAVLTFLHQRIGFDLWMVTRTEGDDWIVLQAEDHGYGVKDGAVFRWADSFCSQMVQGLGPRIAPKSCDVPAYVSAPIGQQVAIGAYVGIPLSDSEGSLFGTLCAIHPTSHPESLHAELPLIELLGQLLSSLLSAELRSSTQLRQLEIRTSNASLDPTTGLINKARWSRILDAEERRCRIYGHPACIVSIRVDGLLGLDETASPTQKQLANETAVVIRKALGPIDSAARLADGQFVIMGAERNASSGKTLTDRLRDDFQAAKISASIRCVHRDPTQGLQAAMEVLLKKEFRI